MTLSIKPILDVACGSRMFWFDKKDPRAVFMDVRPPQEVTLCDGRTIVIAPDVVGDFRAIPWEDETFRLVIFDPPHLIHAGENSWLAAKYGTLNGETWRDDLAAGFSECLRVLKPYGILIFKWNEEQVSTADVLKICPEPPLIGHRRGKTIWLVFMKKGGAA